ncbi:hypothetical protein [Nostoc sp.]
MEIFLVYTFIHKAFALDISGAIALYLIFLCCPRHPHSHWVVVA